MYVEKLFIDNSGYPIYYSGTCPSVYKYHDYSQKIQATSNLDRRVALCEESIPYLLPFVHNELIHIPGEVTSLPPSIPCRDLGSLSCILTGQWERALNLVKECSNAGVYYPENSDSVIIRETHKIILAQLTLEYIQQNPGVLQKDLPKILATDEEDIKFIRYFLRYSLNVNKEKYKGTNKLFYQEHYPEY